MSFAFLLLLEIQRVHQVNTLKSNSRLDNMAVFFLSSADMENDVAQEAIHTPFCFAELALLSEPSLLKNWSFEFLELSNV